MTSYIVKKIICQMKPYEIKWNYLICGTIFQLMITPSVECLGKYAFLEKCFQQKVLFWGFKRSIYSVWSRVMVAKFKFISSVNLFKSYNFLLETFFSKKCIYFSRCLAVPRLLPFTIYIFICSWENIASL